MNCYFKYNLGDGEEIEDHTNSGPCSESHDGSFIQCCGVADTCMGNGICQFSHQDQGGSGYYMGGCTDPNFHDASCPQNCTSNPNSDVVYDFTSATWQCCGNDESGQRNCTSPSGATLTAGAPPPELLPYVATVIATNSFLPLATGVAVLTSTASSAKNTAQVTGAAGTDPQQQQATINNSGSSGLSAGAAAGITVAAVLAVLAIAGLIGWCLWRKKANRGGKEYQYRPPGGDAEMSYAHPPLVDPSYPSPPQGNMGYASPPHENKSYASPPQGATAYAYPPQGATAYASPPPGATAYASPPQGATAYASTAQAEDHYAQDRQELKATQSQRTTTRSELPEQSVPIKGMRPPYPNELGTAN